MNDLELVRKPRAKYGQNSRATGRVNPTRKVNWNNVVSGVRANFMEGSGTNDAKLK